MMLDKIKAKLRPSKPVAQAPIEGSNLPHRMPYRVLSRMHRRIQPRIPHRIAH